MSGRSTSVLAGLALCATLLPTPASAQVPWYGVWQGMSVQFNYNDASFTTGYSTTTMQDCCKPSCAWQDKVTGSGGGHIADGKYNSFYTCSQDGKPLVQP